MLLPATTPPDDRRPPPLVSMVTKTPHRRLRVRVATFLLSRLKSPPPDSPSAWPWETPATSLSMSCDRRVDDVMSGDVTVGVWIFKKLYLYFGKSRNLYRSLTEESYLRKVKWMERIREENLFELIFLWKQTRRIRFYWLFLGVKIRPVWSVLSCFSCKTPRRSFNNSYICFQRLFEPSGSEMFCLLHHGKVF